MCGETENGDGVEKKRDDRTEEEIKIEGVGKPRRDAALWSQALTFKRLIHFQKPTKRKEEPRTEVLFKQGEEGTESLSRGFEGIGIHREILEKLVLKEGESAMRMVDHQGGRPRAVSCRGDLLLLSFLRT